MFSRIVQCEIQTSKLGELRQALNDTVLPTLRQQPGFVDVIESCDPVTGDFVCMTLWRTNEDVQRYEREIFPQHAQQLQPLTTGEVTVKNLPVENSSIHRIAAGKAA